MAERQPTLVEVFKSVLAAFIGVQSNRNRARDFKHGKASHYIVIGLLLTIAFVLLIWGVVRLVLSAAGL